MGGTITSTGSCLHGLPHSGLDQAGQALAMPCSVAVHDLIDLGPAHEEVDVMFPGKADAPVELQRLAAETGKGVVDVGPGGGHRLGRGRSATCERKGGVVG